MSDVSPEIDRTRCPLQNPPDQGILVATAFWICLLTSAVLFASVVSAPRLVEWHDLHLANLERQRQLIDLELHVAHAEKVVHALEYDAEFRDEVIRQDLGPAMAEAGAKESGESIPVSGAMAFDLSSPVVNSPEVPLVIPWYLPVLRTLSTPTNWRRRVLWIAAGFCLVAFVALREREGNPTHEPANQAAESEKTRRRRLRTES